MKASQSLGKVFTEAKFSGNHKSSAVEKLKQAISLNSGDRKFSCSVFAAVALIFFDPKSYKTFFKETFETIVCKKINSIVKKVGRIFNTDVSREECCVYSSVSLGRMLTKIQVYTANSIKIKLEKSGCSI